MAFAYGQGLRNFMQGAMGNAPPGTASAMGSGMGAPAPTAGGLPGTPNAGGFPAGPPGTPPIAQLPQQPPGTPPIAQLPQQPWQPIVGGPPTMPNGAPIGGTPGAFPGAPGAFPGAAPGGFPGRLPPWFSQGVPLSMTGAGGTPPWVGNRAGSTPSPYGGSVPSGLPTGGQTSPPWLNGGPTGGSRAYPPQSLQSQPLGPAGTTGGPTQAYDPRTPAGIVPQNWTPIVGGPPTAPGAMPPPLGAPPQQPWQPIVGGPPSPVPGGTMPGTPPIAQLPQQPWQPIVGGPPTLPGGGMLPSGGYGPMTNPVQRF